MKNPADLLFPRIGDRSDTLVAFRKKLQRWPTLQANIALQFAKAYFAGNAESAIDHLAQLGEEQKNTTMQFVLSMEDERKKYRFGLNEGWRRVCIAVSACLAAYWLIKAGAIQLDVINGDAFSDQLSNARLFVLYAALSPIAISVAARAIHWIHRGFAK